MILTTNNNSVMANYDSLKATIQSVVKQNGNNEITGQLLQQALLSIINSLGADYSFAGIASPSTNPGTPDQNVFYFADSAGTYANFGSLVVSDGEIAILAYNGTWTKMSVGVFVRQSDLSIEQVTALQPIKIEYGNQTFYGASNERFEELFGLYRKSIDVPVSTGFIGRTFITGLNIQSGTPIRFRINSTIPWDRIIVIYNGGVNNRIFDQTGTYNKINGKWITMDAPANIQSLGLSFIVSAPQNSGVVTLELETDGTYSVKDDSITTDKLHDGAVTRIKLSSDIYKILSKILPIETTGNLYNEILERDGYFVHNSGSIMGLDNCTISDFIPVVPGQNYTVTVKNLGRDKGLAFYDSQYQPLTESLTIVGTHTAPENAAFMVIMTNYLGEKNTGIMVVVGDDVQLYKPYGQIGVDKIKNFESEVLAIAGSGETGESRKPLRVTLADNDIIIAKGENKVFCKKTNNVRNEYSGNPFFNFLQYEFNGVNTKCGDDVAPTHTQHTTIGANHGQPCKLATIEGHGLNNTAIGTEWVDGNGIKFYVMNIIDANRILFLSENRGSALSPSFVALSVGTLTRNGNELVVSSVSDAQLYPAQKNQQIRLFADGNSIQDNGTYACNEFKVVETYDIMNTDSVLQNIIARAGTDTPPVFDGDVAVTIETSYIFHRSTNCVIVQNIIPKQNVSFANAMVTQAIRRANDAKYYVPNSLVLPNDLDLRVPTNVQWSSSLSPIGISAEYWADPSNPPRRVLQFFNNDNNGFVVGYLPDKGIGADPASYTSEMFELRNNTGKIYPHVIDSSRVSFVVGTIFTAIMYRCNFIPEQSGNRLSLYHFHFDEAEYVFVDYKGSVVDRVVLDEDFAGKSIEAVELKNCTLENNIYNGGFYINATYVTGETCFAVLKIK